MKKFLAWILLLCITLLLFTSCSDYDSSNDAGASSGGASSDGTTNDNTAKDETSDSRKMIKTYNLSLETKLFNDDCTFIVTEAEKLGGYVSSSSVSGNTMSSDKKSSRLARYTVRIPADQADTYVALLSERCNVYSFNLSTEDITERYYGIQSKLDSLLIQEQKLNEMLGKANNLSEMITLDDKLTEVRTQINELNYMLQNMDKSVEYSYFHINLTEVGEYQSEEKTYGQKLWQSFIGSLGAFVNVLGNLLIDLIWIAPFAIFIAAIIVTVRTIARCKKKKQKNKHDSDQT